MFYDDMETELENAGIDPFEFSLMDEDERRETLEDAFLDPDDFEDFDLEYSFSSTPSYSYTPSPKPVSPPAAPSYFPSPSPSLSPSSKPQAAEQTNSTSANLYRFCGVKFPSSEKTYHYRADGLSLQPGDKVIVPVGATYDPVTATVVSVGDYRRNEAPFPVEKAKFVSRKAIEPYPTYTTAPSSSQIYDSLRATEYPPKKEKPAQHDPEMRFIRITIVALLLILPFTLFYEFSTSPSVVNPSPTYKLEYTPRPSATVKPAATSTPRPISTPRPTPSYPYEGMAESQLSHTGLGPPTSVKKDRNFDAYRPSNQFKKYVWEKNGYTYFEATTRYWKDGKEVPGYVSSIWRSQDFKADHETKVSAPYIGMKLSQTDDELYYLGGGGKIGGISTSKFRYNHGSKTYVVYLDNDNTIRKIEDYLPSSSTKKSSSSSSKPKSDPYNAKDYVHPDDFYYDYYDDFLDYEDAEDYWEKHH